MRLFTLALLATLVASSAHAASYQKTRDRIVDPIQNYTGGDHPYTGNNLEPNANLSGADLTGAKLTSADLDYANLTGANLSDATLSGATLRGADLTGANLTNVDLSESDLSYANLTNADLSDAQSLFLMSYATFSFGTTLPDGQTVAQHGFDAAGLEAYLETDPVDAWEADNLTIVPEPAALLLALLALSAAPLRVRYE